MLKRLLSLNLAIVIVLLLMPVGMVSAATLDNVGYAEFSPNYEDGETVEQQISLFASNGSLKLYEVMPELKRDGYALIGFNSEPDGTGTAYLITQRLYEIYSTEADNVPTLYAQWQAVNGNYLLLRATDGLTSDGKDYYLIDNIVSDSVILPGKDTFVNGDRCSVAWRSAKREYSSTLHLPGDTVAVTEPTIMYAAMGINAIKLIYKDYSDNECTTIRCYNANDGICSRNTVMYSRDIYIGWNSSADGTGEWYTCSSPARTAPQTLYAQYVPVPAEDYYKLCSLSGLENGQEYEVVCLESSEGLPDKIKDSSVAYWYNSYNAQYCIPAGVIPDVVKGTTLYPHSTAEDRYHVIVDGKDGKHTSGSSYACKTFYEVGTVFSSGSALIVTDALVSHMGMFTKDGAVFVGIKETSGDKVYTLYDRIGESILATIGENNIAEYEAVYESVEGGYIQYLANGGTMEDGTGFVVQDGIDISSNETVVCINDKPTRTDGKNFIGWNTKVDGSGTWYDPGDAIVVENNMILYAQWASVRVNYFKSTSSDFEPYVVNNSDSEISPRWNLPDKEDYFFSGWNSKRDGTGTWYTAGRKIQIPSDYAVVDVYAQWEAKPEIKSYYVLRADAFADGKLVKVVTMATKSELVTLPDTDDLDENTTLIAWHCHTSSCSNLSSFYADVHPKAVVLPGGEVEVKHQMEFRNVLAVEYIGNGAKTSGGKENRIYVFHAVASSANLALSTAQNVFTSVPSNKKFVGWNTEADGSGTNYNSGTRVSMSLRLYAQWEDINVTPTPPIPSTPPAPPIPSTPPTYPILPSLPVVPVLPDIKTETKLNVDGSITKTYFNLKTGVVTQITSYSNGATLTVVDYPSGKQDISVYVPYGMTTKFVIPVSNMNYNKVPVIIRNDGTKEVINDFKVCEEGMIISLRESAKIDIVDYSNNFYDVPDNAWFKVAVDFVSVRGIMTGITDTNFSPYSTTTRAMVLTMLARMNGVDTTKGAVWYESGIEWAKSLGISDGSKANEAITREQLVVMLWRIMGTPNASQADMDKLSSYPDATAVRAYAREAMAWAVGTGIINGMDNGNLNSGSSATRAQIAQIFMSFMINCWIGA